MGNTAVKGILVLALVVLAESALASIDLKPRNLVDNLTWAGGDITRTYDLCVSSVAGKNKKDTNIIPYRVLADVAGNFQLVSGVNVVPFTVSWVDLKTSVTDNLAAGTSSAEDKTGELDKCPGGNNGRLVVFFDQVNLVSAPPGTYTARLAVKVTNSGTGRSTRVGRVDYTLVVPDSIRVTQLDTINLGTFDSVNDMAGQDQLCLFRRSGGTYSVTLSGAGAGGAFELLSGTSAIPFAVTWDDGGGAASVAAGVALAGRQNSYSLDEYCAGGAANNATLAVSVLANDILSLATVPGAHLGVITVMVQPE